MKLIHLLLTIALIVPFMGCDSITLDNTKIDKLRARVAQLEDQVTHWEAANTRLQNERGIYRSQLKALENQYNDLVTVNRALIAEKRTLDAKHKHAVDTIDAIMDLVAREEEKLLNVKKASSWPPSKGDKLTFRIDFDNNQLYNREDSREAARMIKAYDKANNGNIKITVEGYSSKSGSAASNMALSLERAEGVMFKIYEAFNSADPLNMEVIAHGETDDDERKVIITVEVL